MAIDTTPVVPPPPQPDISNLPRDAAGAQAMREQLIGNAEFMKDWSTDQLKWTALGFLRWVASGNDPDRWGKPPEGSSDVAAQDTDRLAAQLDMHGQVLDKHFDLTPKQQFEVLMQRPVYQWEKDNAAREYEKLRADADFMSRWSRGDRVSR